MLSSLVLLIGCACSCLAAPAIDYMTKCERTLHTECVLQIGSSKQFEEKCQPDELLKCLRNTMLSNVCTVEDSDTLPTIKQLISYVERKFKKDPKFCQERRKLKSFVERLQYTFKVQGEGIEFTDPRNIQEFGSGSAENGQVPDDTETDGEDDDDDDDNKDDIIKNDIIKKNDGSKEATTITKTKVEKSIETNSVKKDSKFWKKTSKLINRGKNERGKVQNIVYFDDQKASKKRKQKEDEKRLQKAWQALKMRYQKWYENSKYYR
ncbi:uncharacterized protein [Clytia hemisphaerica]|uniref:Uncharacterized protein n=1 Tax=Clytia hemisphaerica TaxID=252671 RepID=A0A7M6DLA6_9CNID|eukprot:TCONS_00021067-protein